MAKMTDKERIEQLAETRRKVRKAERDMKAGKGTGITPVELVVLAACFAVSNMGQPKPSRDTVQHMLGSKRTPSLSGAVLQVAEQYMETDEHQHIFEDEANCWFHDLRAKTREYVAAAWPDMATLMWPEEQGA